MLARSTRSTRPTRRPWWQRLAALCLAVWFAVTTADLPALHTCAMHGMAGDTDAAGMMAAMATPAMGAMAPGAMAMPAAAPARGGHEGRHEGHGHSHAGHVCSCMGACCGAAILEPSAPGALVVAAREVEAPVAPGRPAHEYVAAWVDFVLPFSTAPPAGASA